MGKTHPVELRQRAVDFVEEGHSHRSAAAQFSVSIKFVNDMVKLKRETGSLAPRLQGNGGGHGNLCAVRGWLKTRMTEEHDLTLDDLDVAQHPGRPAEPRNYLPLDLRSHQPAARMARSLDASTNHLRLRRR